MADRPRLFIALPLPAHVVEALDRLLADLRPRNRDVKWVRAESIHLTVKFLGDTDPRLIGDIGQCIDMTADEYRPIETEFDRIGAFPNLRRPNVIWVGPSEPLPEAAEMANNMNERLAELGLEPEKKQFRPHLTLGRVRRGKRVDDLAAYLESYQLPPIPLRLDRLVLFQSTLTPTGAIYKRLHETDLGAERFGG